MVENYLSLSPIYSVFARYSTAINNSFCIYFYNQPVVDIEMFMELCKFVARKPNQRNNKIKKIYIKKS